MITKDLLSPQNPGSDSFKVSSHQTYKEQWIPTTHMNIYMYIILENNMKPMTLYIYINKSSMYIKIYKFYKNA